MIDEKLLIVCVCGVCVCVCVCVSACVCVTKLMMAGQITSSPKHFATFTNK